MTSFLRTVALGALLLSGCVSEPFVAYRVREIPPGLSSDEIVRMAKVGIPDSTIVEQIKNRGVRAGPTADEIVALKKEGLSDAVLQAMSQAPVRSGEKVVVQEIYDYPYYYPYSYPYYGYGPYGYGWPYWSWPYAYPYYYPYGGWHYHGGYSGGSIHHYRP